MHICRRFQFFTRGRVILRVKLWIEGDDLQSLGVGHILYYRKRWLFGIRVTRRLFETSEASIQNMTNGATRRIGECEIFFGGRISFLGGLTESTVTERGQQRQLIQVQCAEFWSQRQERPERAQGANFEDVVFLRK
jgi:hypothetical protein